ncbi:MAG TPA: VWA domain-containing protein, partial [candidate division Zixibacteria bacterium]|nr:VWA domain-containing protein [candidate division Zixibacteria bacterium]
AGFHISVFDWLDLTIPGWALLLTGGVALAALAYFYWRTFAATTSSLRYSDLRALRSVARSGRSRLRPLLPILRLVALALFIVALARPQSGNEEREINAEGIDIVLALDISGSMKAEDFKPHNRLEAAKEEIKDFVSKRISDRIGMVVFAKSAFTQCPLTLDYNILLGFLEQINFGMIEDGTAIGTAIATAANRLKDSDGKSKVIVLLTDGVNNSGEIDPLTAANIAETFGIRIYTIGAGRPGNAMYPVDDPIFGKRYAYLPNEIDEETLTEIAERTGGKYFRARSEDELNEIYSEIDELEKNEISVKEYVNYQEMFPLFLLLGFATLCAEVTLGQTLLRKAP